MIHNSPRTYGTYQAFVTELSKTVSSTLDGTDNGLVTIKRDSVSGIVTIVNFIPPVTPNLSCIYFFEKEDVGNGSDTFLFLIDVTLDSEIRPSLGTSNLQAFLDNAAANPNDFLLEQAVRDQENFAILTEFKSPIGIDLNLFEAAKKVRIVKWTSDFTCPIPNNPVPT